MFGKSDPSFSTIDFNKVNELNEVNELDCSILITCTYLFKVVIILLFK